MLSYFKTLLRPSFEALTSNEGAEVFRNKDGKYLYHHEQGQWRTNNVINDRGVLKGVNRGKGECVSPDSKWYYWDKKWRRGKIEVSCDQDSGTHEQGRFTGLQSLVTMFW